MILWSNKRSEYIYTYTWISHTQVNNRIEKHEYLALLKQLRDSSVIANGRPAAKTYELYDKTSNPNSIKYNISIL